MSCLCSNLCSSKKALLSWANCLRVVQFSPWPQKMAMLTATQNKIKTSTIHNCTPVLPLLSLLSSLLPPQQHLLLVLVGVGSHEPTVVYIHTSPAFEWQAIQCSQIYSDSPAPMEQNTIDTTVRTAYMRCTETKSIQAQTISRTSKWDFSVPNFLSLSLHPGVK